MMMMQDLDQQVGGNTIQRFNTSCHIEVKNTSFFKGCF